MGTCTRASSPNWPGIGDEGRIYLGHDGQQRKRMAVQELSACGLRIAQISNNPALRSGFHMMLKECPFVSEITDVAVSSQAVEIVRREKPEIVVVDVKLADADTSELIRALRAAASDLHILVLSELSDET